jgi:hypothetical protein
MIRVYDEAGNLIETREHAGDFKRVVSFSSRIMSHFPLEPTFQCFRFYRAITKQARDFAQGRLAIA